MGQELQWQCLDMLGIHLKLAFLVMSKDSWRLVTKGKDQHSSTMQHLAIQTVVDILSLREAAQEEVTLYITVHLFVLFLCLASMQLSPDPTRRLKPDPTRRRLISYWRNESATKDVTSNLHRSSGHGEILAQRLDHSTTKMAHSKPALHCP